MKISAAAAGIALAAFALPAVAGGDWGYAEAEYYYTINRSSIFSLGDIPGYEYIQVKTGQRNEKICRVPESENITLTLNKQPVPGERHVWQKRGECQITLIIRGKPALQEVISTLGNNHPVIIQDITGTFKISSRGFKEIYNQ